MIYMQHGTPRAFPFRLLGRLIRPLAPRLADRLRWRRMSWTPMRPDADGVRRRLRLPFVRSTLREKARQEHGIPAHLGNPVAVDYRYPWSSLNALTKFSPACVCHKRPRYRDRDRQREKRVAA